MEKGKVLILVVFLIMLMMVGCGSKDAVSDAGSSSDAGESAKGDGAAASEDTSLKDIQEKGVFVLGLDDAFPPMGFKNDDQEIIGFDIDAAEEVCKRMGVKLEVVPISWDAKEQELKTKHIDCIWNGFTSNEEREKQMQLSKPYMKNTQVAVVLASSGITSLEDLAGKKVVIQNGSTASDAMDENAEFTKTLKELVKVEDNVLALMDLKVKGSDAVVMDEVVARYYVDKEPDTYTILESTLADEEYVVAFRKGEAALCAEVEKQLKAMADDGVMAELSNKWLGKDLTIVE